jgi:hypothetical protein
VRTREAYPPRAALALAAFSAFAAFALVVAAGDARADGMPSPHRMTKPDGSLDPKTCGVCHKPDMGLLGTKTETCTLCHGATSHSGAAEHLRAKAARVADAMSTRPKGGPTLPLDEKGGIWCGTCHVFHDPKVLGEKWLAQGWVPPDSGVPGAVRTGVTQRWEDLASAHGAKGPGGTWAKAGTRQLRASYEDGSLCLQCHGGLR